MGKRRKNRDRKDSRQQQLRPRAKRARNCRETRKPIIGLLVAAALAIVASLRHLALFTAGSPSCYVWFGTLGLITLFSATLSILALRAPRE